MLLFQMKLVNFALKGWKISNYQLLTYDQTIPITVFSFPSEFEFPGFHCNYLYPPFHGFQKL